MFVPIEEVDFPEEQQKAAFQQYGFEENNEPLTVLLKDDTACIRCGLCALRCPTEAMTMEKFNFIEKDVS
jgi:ferredoxin